MTKDEFNKYMEKLMEKENYEFLMGRIAKQQVFKSIGYDTSSDNKLLSIIFKLSGRIAELLKVER